MAKNLLIRQRQQFVRFMRSRGVAFDEIARMLQEIDNPSLAGSIGNEESGMFKLKAVSVGATEVTRLGKAVMPVEMTAMKHYGTFTK